MAREFEDFKKYLDPDNLSLISILQFYRDQDDFTYNKLNEHALISKFLMYLLEMPEWSKAALSLKKDELLLSNNAWSSYGCSSQQTKNEKVVRFWINQDNERIKLEIKQIQVYLISYIKYQDVRALLTQFCTYDLQNQFIVDRSISNNKAHDLIEEQKLNLILKQALNDEPFFRKRWNGKLSSTAINVETSQRSLYNKNFLLDSDSEVVTSIPYTNIFLASSSQQQISVEPIDINGVKPIDSSPFLVVSEKDEKKKTTRKYINHNLTDKVLKSYQTQVLPDDIIMLIF
ncbi:hypothetical protein C1645_821390 [Glomus cerebriforme]|uniref:Uncharacterized protein n=1 Tax=Glomus cerebriforme TaxID=658196 RepID=A0A397T4T3_9GLOM|nr:hypothetical protein C1645_821390 [Glomus cerebriforme]